MRKAGMHPGAASAVAALLALGGAAAAPPSGAAQTGCRDATLAPNAGNAAAIERSALCLINLQRARRHLRSLRANRALARIAAGQSRDMVRGNYFADHSLSGRTPLERIVPALRPAHVAATAQNIGWGKGADATPEGIVDAWMASPPHRRIMLTAAYLEAGVGVAASLPAVLEQGSDGATYVLDLTAFANGPSTPAAVRHAPAPARTPPAAENNAAPLVRIAQQVIAASTPAA